MASSGSADLRQMKTKCPELQIEKAAVSDQTRQYRERLRKEIDEVERGLSDLEQRLAEKGDYSLGEGDPSIYLWEMNLARRQRLQARVEELQKAMARLERGAYEQCSICGGQIEEGRLELLPTTRMCSRCARAEK
jgi:RNA polymerase-binding transcription factor DksA